MNARSQNAVEMQDFAMESVKHDVNALKVS